LHGQCFQLHQVAYLQSTLPHNQCQISKLLYYIQMQRPISDIQSVLVTRKLCYSKDHRAMRSIHGCLENFRDSLTTPTATIPNIFSWAFVPIDPVNVPTKLEVRSFTRS